MSYSAAGLYTKSGNPYQFDMGGNPIDAMGAPIGANDLPDDAQAQLKNIQATSASAPQSQAGIGTALPGASYHAPLPGAPAYNTGARIYTPSNPAPKNFLPGGSPTIPATAKPISPQQMSPSTFAPQGGPAKIVTTGPPSPLTPYQPLPNYLQPIGFSNANHLGEVPTVTEPKYAVENVIQQMASQPGFDPLNFAPAAADQLNAMFGTNEFWSADGQTLMYGDEYVHTAPAGYSGSDPAGAEALFWGTTNNGGDSSSWGAPPTTKPGPHAVADPTATAGGAAGGTDGNLGGGIDFGSLISSALGPAPANTSQPGGFAPTGGPLQPDLNQAGQDPLSQLVNSTLAGEMQTGSTPYGKNVEATLADIIGGGAVPGADQSKSLIAARDAEAMAEQGMLSDTRNQLASRGTASEPGVPQGPEQFGIGRIQEQLAPQFANAVASIEQHGLDLQNSNVMTALQEATGLSEAEATNILNAAGLGTNRQGVLANIALQTLDQNTKWQEFLAGYGLDRDKIAADIQNGNMATVVSLIDEYLKSVSTSAGGFI